MDNRQFTFCDFEVIPARRQLLRSGEPVQVSSRAFDILLVFVRSPGEVISKADLMTRAWPNTHVDEVNLRVQISGLRKALGEDGVAVREPHIYGRTTLAEIQRDCESAAKDLKVSLNFLQSNHEGQIVDWIQAARDDADTIIINPAAHSFYSVAIFDALKAFEGPIIELHLSNIHARDELHRHSIMSSAATAVICGLGPLGYPLAMQAAARLWAGRNSAGVTNAA